MELEAPLPGARPARPRKLRGLSSQTRLALSISEARKRNVLIANFKARLRGTAFQRFSRTEILNSSERCGGSCGLPIRLNNPAYLKLLSQPAALKREFGPFSKRPVPRVGRWLVSQKMRVRRQERSGRINPLPILILFGLLERRVRLRAKGGTPELPFFDALTSEFEFRPVLPLRPEQPLDGFVAVCATRRCFPRDLLKTNELERRRP
jgi:hypothetical protein